MGVLHSRSRSEQRFRMLVTVCLDDIFWTTERSVTKLGIVMQHHEPECHAEGAHLIKTWLFLLYLLNCWFLGNQTWSDDTSSKARVFCEKIGWLFQGQGHSEGPKCQCLSRWYLLNRGTFFNQSWYCDASLRARMLGKRLVCYFQGQGHSKGSYDQNMIISTISAELLILLLPNLVWWYTVISQNVARKMGLLCSRSRSQQFFLKTNVCADDIFWITEPFTAKLGVAMHHYELDIFSKKIGLLSSRSRSQWRII